MTTTQPSPQAQDADTAGVEEPLAGPLRAVPGRPDDRARPEHRERRAALHPYRPRLLAGLAGLGGERLPAHLRRLPAPVRPARRPARQPPGLPRRRGLLHDRLRRVRPGAQRVVPRRRPRGPGSGRSHRLRRRPRADHGAVQLTRRPGQGDGRLRLRDVRRRRRRRPGRRRADRPAQLALDLPRERPRRRRRRRRRPCDAAGRRRGARLDQARRPRRRAGHLGADARGLRRRRRQRGRLDLDPHPDPAGVGGRPLRRLRRPRDQGGRAAGAAAPVQAAQRVGLAGGRRPLGRRDVRLVLPGRALPPAGAGLQRPRGRPRVRPDQPGDDVLLAEAVRPPGDEVRHPRPADRRPRAGRGLAGAVRDRPGRRQLRDRRAALDGAARHRCRHRLQPGAAGRDGRRRAPRGRTRLRCRQHLLHDGRRSRPGRPGRGLRLAHRIARGRRILRGRGAARWPPGRLRGRRRLRRPGCRGRRGVPPAAADGDARAGCGGRRGRPRLRLRPEPCAA